MGTTKTPTKTTTRNLASIADAAEYAGCSDKTIRRLIYSGRLTGYRLGSKLIRVDLDELIATMAPIPAARRSPGGAR